MNQYKKLTMAKPILKLYGQKLEWDLISLITSNQNCKLFKAKINDKIYHCTEIDNSEHFNDEIIQNLIIYAKWSVIPVPIQIPLDYAYHNNKLFFLHTPRQTIWVPQEKQLLLQLLELTKFLIFNEYYISALDEFISINDWYYFNSVHIITNYKKSYAPLILEIMDCVDINNPLIYLLCWLYENMIKNEKYSISYIILIQLWIAEMNF